jgi:hypothetical protein
MEEKPKSMFSLTEILLLLIVLLLVYAFYKIGLFK